MILWLIICVPQLIWVGALLLDLNNFNFCFWSFLTVSRQTQRGLSCFSTGKNKAPVSSVFTPRTLETQFARNYFALITPAWLKIREIVNTRNSALMRARQKFSQTGAAANVGTTDRIGDPVTSFLRFFIVVEKCSKAKVRGNSSKIQDKKGKS